MLSRSQSHRGCFAVILLAALAALFSPMLVAAQDQPAPKWEFYGGYSFMHYNADVHGTLPLGLVPLSSRLTVNPRGIGASATYNFNRWFGLTLDGSGNWDQGERTLSEKIDDANFANLSVGPKITYRRGRVSPFLEGLVGVHRLDPLAFHDISKLGVMAGGGLDVNLSRHIALRLLRADYVFSNYQFGPKASTPETQIRGVRLQTGLVFMFGGGEAVVTPVAASCGAQPTEVMAGEPVKVTLTPSNFNPKRTLSYNWTATGGTVSGTETTATVDTAGLAPGSYAVNGKVTDNGKGKKQMSTGCTANFTVLEPPKHPPTITCSATPTTVKSGDSSTITCQGNSPDNRPLTYAWNATAGRVSGNGTTATLDTAGAPAGPITINTTVSDDRPLTASATSSVNVEVPPPPPQASKLNEILFPNEKKPWRVDNTAKAVLDDVALRLQREPESKAVVVGFATAGESREKTNQNLAAQRAFNTKEYLTKEKGIDPSRIEIRTGTGENQTAEIWLVPAGASFTGEGTTVVDESKMAAPAKKPVKRAKKAAAAPTN